MTPVLQLASELIACESVSPSDAGCQDIIRTRLEKLGLTITDFSRNNTTNTYALKRFGDGPILCFAGHTDVVPSGPTSDWVLGEKPIEPFAFTEHEGKLYGRGIADMKGAVAAMVCAGEEFVQKNDDVAIGGLAYLITSDEEADRTDGTSYVIEELQKKGERIDMVVLGEPSGINEIGDRIYTARRGSYHLRPFVINGLAGHVAKGNGIDAAEIAARIQCRALDHTWDENPDPRFPDTSFKTWVLEGGHEVENMVSARVVLAANWRNNPSTDGTMIQKQFEKIAHEEYERVAGGRCPSQKPLEFGWRFDGASYVTDNDSAFVTNIRQALKKTLGRDPELSGGGGISDGGTIATIGAQVVELGVQGGTIHEPNENIPVGALEELTNAYIAIMEELLLQK